MILTFSRSRCYLRGGERIELRRDSSVVVLARIADPDWREGTELCSAAWNSELHAWNSDLNARSSPRQYGLAAVRGGSLAVARRNSSLSLWKFDVTEGEGVLRPRNSRWHPRNFELQCGQMSFQCGLTGTPERNFELHRRSYEALPRDSERLIPGSHARARNS